MKILITNHWLRKLGGSETFTYTLVKAAKEFGHDVDLMTVFEGSVSDRIRKDFGVKAVYSPNCTYDLILANHHTTVDICNSKKLGPIIQTCHGTIPRLEQPSEFAQAYVGISEEVKNHVQKKTNRSCSVILNSIDINRFKDRTVLAPKIMSVLSLSHSDKLNAELRLIFNKKGIQFKSFNKYTNPVWEVEKEIWQHDLVVSLGRGAYESFACGRPVLVLDKRPYQILLSDGLALPKNMEQLASCNFSGRYKKCIPFNFEEYINEELELYNDDNQLFYRQWAVENLNYIKNFEKYMELWKSM